MAPIRPSNIGREERGAALVEFAMALPLLLVVLAGIVDFGLAFQRYEIVTNAAREGARLGALPGYADGDITNRVKVYVAAGLGIDTTKLNATSVMSAGDAVATTRQFRNIGGGTNIPTVTVTVKYRHQWMLLGPILGLINKSWGQTITLTASSEMRREG